MVSLIKRDEEYDINIKLNYQRNSQLFNGTAIQYDFIGAKIATFDDGLSTSQRRNNNLIFTLELNPIQNNKGLFVSGYLGIPNAATNFVFLEEELDLDGEDYLVFENDDEFAIYLSGHKILY